LNTEFTINGTNVKPGSTVTLDIAVTKLYTHTPVAIPVRIIRGKQDGPRLFICAAIHGDEIAGVEIIRRLLRKLSPKKIKGTLIAIPIVNVHGFINHSRYLPDRRDLNRCFPGSNSGSLAARLAHLFISEIVEKCTHGIDLHTGAIHRSNLPQIRANLDDPESAKLAKDFGVPVILNADIRDGSLREAAAALGIPILLYEAGEALRFDEISIRAGVKGIQNIMRALDMLPPRKTHKIEKEPFIARSSVWIRSPASGVFWSGIPLGTRLVKGQQFGIISDPFGEEEVSITSPHEGIIIGKTNLPLINEGDALVHIARFGKSAEVAETLEEFQDKYQPADWTEMSEGILKTD